MNAKTKLETPLYVCDRCGAPATAAVHTCPTYKELERALAAIHDLRAEKASWGRIADDAVTESERLRAERDALREALREICHRIGNDRSDLAEELRDFARAALAAQEKP